MTNSVFLICQQTFINVHKVCVSRNNLAAKGSVKWLVSGRLSGKVAAVDSNVLLTFHCLHDYYKYIWVNIDNTFVVYKGSERFMIKREVYQNMTIKPSVISYKMITLVF